MFSLAIHKIKCANAFSERMWDAYALQKHPAFNSIVFTYINVIDSWGPEVLYPVKRKHLSFGWKKQQKNPQMYHGMKSLNAPAMFSRGHIVSPLSLLTYVRLTELLKMVSFHYHFGKKNCIVDFYFIHRYIIIKYRSCSIMGKIYQLFGELWPFLT